MDEKLEYENMLDIPINTSSITKATKKRKLFKKVLWLIYQRTLFVLPSYYFIY